MFQSILKCKDLKWPENCDQTINIEVAVAKKEKKKKKEIRKK